MPQAYSPNLEPVQAPDYLGETFEEQSIDPSQMEHQDKDALSTDGNQKEKRGSKRMDESEALDDHRKSKRTKVLTGVDRARISTTHLVANPNQNPSMWEDVKDAETLEKLPEFNKSTSQKGAWVELQINMPDDMCEEFRRDKAWVKKAMRNFSGKGYFKPADHGEWSARGMNSSIKPHQVISAGFMRGREKGQDLPKGGIIADTMGFGKTVKVLLNIVNGRADHKSDISDENHPLQTLIVVPSALLGQWYEEALKHCEEGINKGEWGIGLVMCFKSAEAKWTQPSSIYKNTVVFTSYDTVRQSLRSRTSRKSLSVRKRVDRSEQDEGSQRGPLHRTKFLRIILDEGHEIRSRDTQTLRAIQELDAEFRWVLTGTPMINGSFDLYNLFNFIRHPEICGKITYDEFKAKYDRTKDGKPGGKIPHDLLQCMHGFTHSGTLFGSRVIDLPSNSVSTTFLKPYPLEAAIYRIVQKRFRKCARSTQNDDSEGTTRLNPLTILSLLRQASSHPLLPKPEMFNPLKREDLDKLNKIFQKETTKDIEKRSNTDGQNAGAKKSVPSTMRNINQSRRSDRTPCTSCEMSAKEARVVNCGHVYCVDCLLRITTMHLTEVNGPTAPRCTGEGCGEVMGIPERLDTEADDLPRWLDTKGGVYPSAKTDEVKSQISKWLDPNEPDGDPTNKILVFTHWHEMIHILSKIFQLAGWNFDAMYGKVTQKERETITKKFQTDPSVKILLLTYGTGGVGLNLTAANRVILMDPQWHETGEDQALSRSYR